MDLYYQDIEVGDEFVTATRTTSESDDTLGDTIHVRMVLAEKHLTSDPARGIFNWHVEVFNQKNEVVSTGTWIKMIANRSTIMAMNPIAML